MTDELRSILTAARALSPREKLELLEAISRDLQQAYALVDESAAFWTPPSLEELAENVPVVDDLHMLAADFWPQEDSADLLNQFVAEQRQADRANGA